MKDFTIYRVPSLKKVGCSRNFKKSCRERYSGRRVVVLEIVPAKFGPKYAGNIEWAYAVKFGYKRHSHYLNTWDFKLTKRQRSIFGSMSPNLFNSNTGRKTARWKGRKGFAAMDPAKLAHISSIGGKARHGL